MNVDDMVPGKEYKLTLKAGALTPLPFPNVKELDEPIQAEVGGVCPHGVPWEGSFNGLVDKALVHDMIELMMLERCVIEHAEMDPT